MYLNLKHQEIIEDYIKELLQKFPEIEFIDVVESPEDSDARWIRVTNPPSEEREMELYEFTGQRAIEILDDYGYHVLIFPTMKDDSISSNVPESQYETA